VGENGEGGGDKIWGSKGPVTGPNVIFRARIRKNRACIDTFYDRTFSLAYSTILERLLVIIFGVISSLF